MAKSKGLQQSRLVEPVVEIQEEPKLYRASLLAERQKFGDRKRDQAIQKWLFQEMEGQRESEGSLSGLDLNESEAKALHVIQQFLDKTDYEGNLPGREGDGKNEFKWAGKIPKLFIKCSEYFDAYGLTRKGDGSYYSHQAQEAIEALRSLQETRILCYSRTKWEDGKKLYDVIRTKTQVIRIVEGFHNLTAEEKAEVEAGGDVPGKRARGFVVEVSPLLMDGISNIDFYVLKPSSLFKEIKQLHSGKRPSRKVSLFIEWLLTKNWMEVKARMDTLIMVLRLDWCIRQRKRAKAEAIIRECVEKAKRLQYLTDSREELGLFTFTLNPERCKRIKEADPGQDKADPGQEEEE